MQPASLDLTLHRGDDAVVRFLFADGDGEPIVLGADEISLELDWGRDSETLTDGAGLAVDGPAGEVVWNVAAALSQSLPDGRVTRLALVRETEGAGRRTYAVGYINATDGEAPGDQDVTLTVEDLEVTVVVTGPAAGADGVGVPAGGTEGQVLAKASGDDFDTEWVTPSGGGGGGSVAWDDITGKPAKLLALEALTWAANKLIYLTGAATAAVTDLSAYMRGLLASADLAALKTALAYVKGDVGLGSVDNTADADKPVSTAQQQALDLKAPLASPALTGNPTAPTQTAGNNSTRVATTAFVTDAISTAGGGFQPLDSDLTAIAALSTTAFGRGLLALADAAAGRTALGLGTAALSASGDFQPADADLTAIAALTTTSYGRAFLALADAAAGRTALGLGTAALSASGDFQPADSDLTAIAALTTTSYGRAFLALADAAAGRTALGLGTAAVEAASAFQPADADLTAIAALTTTSFGRSLLTLADQAALDALLATAIAAAKPVEFITVALSDETTDITTGTAKLTMRMPYAFTLTAVRASLSTASSSGTPTVDINEGGSTILSTKLTIDANEKTSTTAATAAVISDSSLADDAEITFDIDAAGTGAKGLKVTLIGRRA